MKILAGLTVAVLLMLCAVLSGSCTRSGSSARRAVVAGPIVVEAENMQLQLYELEEHEAYSRGKGVMLKKIPNAFKTGTADYTFSGDRGYYSIDITYVDEAEPLAPIDKRYAKYVVEIVRDNTARQVDHWVANKELNDHTISEETLTVRKIERVALRAKDVIRIKGTATGGEHAEHARLDKIVITPIEWSLNRAHSQAAE